jgi:hypothetical protein
MKIQQQTRMHKTYSVKQADYSVKGLPGHAMRWGHAMACPYIGAIIGWV